MSPGDWIRRAFLLRRYENALALAVARMLYEARVELVALLTRQDPSTLLPAFRQARLDAVARTADALITDTYADIHRLTTTNLTALGEVETSWTARQIAAMTGIPVADLTLPTRAEVRALVLRDPVEGAVMGDWWRMQSRASRERFRTLLRAGIARGDEIRTIAAKVQGTPTAAGNVLNRAQAETLVRTAVHQVSNEAALATYASSGVADSYEYVATLDTRTTERCRTLDGQVFRVDDPAAPRPPQHWNCRSTTIPRVRGVAPPQRETYGPWLRRQSPEVQNQVLGFANAERFRAGASLADLLRRDQGLGTLQAMRDQP